MSIILIKAAHCLPLILVALPFLIISQKKLFFAALLILILPVNLYLSERAVWMIDSARDYEVKKSWTGYGYQLTLTQKAEQNLYDTFIEIKQRGKRIRKILLAKSDYRIWTLRTHRIGSLVEYIANGQVLISFNLTEGTYSCLNGNLCQGITESLDSLGSV